MDAKKAMERGEAIWNRAQELMRDKLKKFSDEGMVAKDVVLEQHAQIIAASAFEKFMKSGVSESASSVFDAAAKDMYEGLEALATKTKRALN